jgi:phenylacetic acid degradation operon negative regulatory protein
MRKRLDVSAPAAPAGIALLMILGVYLLDGPEGVSQATLVLALQRLGYTGHAARQAIARAMRGGTLAAERDGRRARMSLTPAGAELLRDGEQRLFTFGESWSWDGSWLLVSLRVPEAQRDARHRLRKRLGWAGFGSLGNGLWLSPHPDREAAVAHVLADEPAAQAWTFRATHGELGDLDLLVRQAWDIDAMVTNYESFIADFSRVRATTDEECFVALTSMLMRWREFPFVDPDLPPELLPKGWLRARAYRIFHERRNRWIDPMREYLASCEPLHSATRTEHLTSGQAGLPPVQQLSTEAGPS